MCASHPFDINRRRRFLDIRCQRGNVLFALLLFLESLPSGKSRQAGGRLLHEGLLVREVYHILGVEHVRPEGINGVVTNTRVHLDEELSRARRIEDTGVRQEDVHQTGILVEPQGVLALVRQEGADIDGEVLLVRQRRQERQRELVIIRGLVKIRRESVVIAQRF